MDSSGAVGSDPDAQFKVPGLIPVGLVVIFWMRPQTNVPWFNALHGKWVSLYPCLSQSSL